MLSISDGWLELIKAVGRIFDTIEKCVVSSSSNLFKSESFGIHKLAPKFDGLECDDREQKSNSEKRYRMSSVLLRNSSMRFGLTSGD